MLSFILVVILRRMKSTRKLQSGYCLSKWYEFFTNDKENLRDISSGALSSHSVDRLHRFKDDEFDLVFQQSRLRLKTSVFSISNTCLLIIFTISAISLKRIFRNGSHKILSWSWQHCRVGIMIGKRIWPHNLWIAIQYHKRC